MYSEKLTKNDTFEILVARAKAIFYKEHGLMEELEYLQHIFVERRAGLETVHGDIIAEEGFSIELKFSPLDYTSSDFLNVFKNGEIFQVYILSREYDVPNFYLHDCYLREVSLDGESPVNDISITLKIEAGLVEKEEVDD